MRTLILTTLFAVALFAQEKAVDQAKDQGSVAPAPQAKTLTRAELDKLLSKPGSVFLLDVRNPQEIEIGRAHV